jgi:glycine/D-amino acid oxidase-like deaminating enzyme/nitrite reductase/ring-hydroxylating ferredoxin subunit
MESMSPNSYWYATESVRDVGDRPPLCGDVETDAAVVGAGITGLTTALHLQSAGQRVVVLEAGEVGAGTTGGTSGHLDALPDQGAAKLIHQYGKDAAREVTQARLQAIGQIEEWSQQFGINCEFQRIPAYLYSESAAEELSREADAIRELGLEVESTSSIGLPWMKSVGLRVPQQARIHSLRYVRGLAREFCARGGVIHERTVVRPPSDDGRTLQTAQGSVTARRAVVLCTHSAFLGRSQFDMRVAPYQSYVIAVRVAESIPDALYWDDAEPYHYLRLASSADPHLLIVGGADHKTGQGGDERESMQRLEHYARERFSVGQIESKWSAEFFEPADGLPYIGAVPGSEGLYIGTGFSGTGLTFGTLAGRLLADLVVDRSDGRLVKTFAPSRLKPLAAGPRLLSENLNVARRFVADRLTTASVKSFSEIAPGTGQLVRCHGQALAVFRDDQGALHTLSPVCTHMGCFVQWNEQERTWDCPCHGGRFSATGERLYGPPPQDLDALTPKGA